jgi:hypothetical protein
MRSADLAAYEDKAARRAARLEAHRLDPGVEEAGQASDAQSDETRPSLS